MSERNEQTALFIAEIEAAYAQHDVKKLIDATYGEGGHGLYFARKGFAVLGIEWDKEMFDRSKAILEQTELKGSVQLVNENFKNCAEVAQKEEFIPADAVVIDLGLSLRQLRHSGRGFTVKGDEPLDLRINKDQGLTAADIINGNSKEELYDFFTKNIEDVATVKFLDALMHERYQGKISTVGALKKIIATLNMNEKQQMQFLRKVLQGLRIIVNEEVENLRGILSSLSSVLRPGGIACIITFYSTEDRLVKLFFKGNSEFTTLGKPAKNQQFTFAKSAKLRIYEKI